MRPLATTTAALLICGVGGLPCMSGCAGRSQAQTATAVPGAEIPFNDASLLDPGVVDEGPALAAALQSAAPDEALAALDRCLDLFDAARFAGSGDARDALWIALGDPVGPARGPEATRDAINRLLQAAWAIEDRAPELAPEARQLLNDAIALLSVDSSPPATADDLSIQTSAYRKLAKEGHPRVRDNAHWRLYDHARGVLEAATRVPAEARVDVAVHVLYAESANIEGHLNDEGPHARAPIPSAADLLSVLDRHRTALEAHPRWAPVVSARAESDAALASTVATLLPVPRAPDWPAPAVPLGTGKADTFAPVLLAQPIGVLVDPGHEDASALSPHNQAFAERLTAATAADGRATVLLVASAELPAPDLAAILRATGQAQLSSVAIGVREPDGVLTTLPLQIVGRGGGPGDLAFRDARVQLRLEGRGLRAAIDGRWLPGHATTAAETSSLLDQLRRAYPHQKVLGLTLDRNVQPVQLINLLSAAIGGTEPRFVAAGWLSDAGERPAPGDAAVTGLLDARGSLWHEDMPAPKIDQAYPLPGDDQRRLTALGGDLQRCLPELEVSGVSATVTVQFGEGHAKSHEVSVTPASRRRADRPAKGARAAFDTCVDEQLSTFRLRQQRDAVALGFELAPPAAGAVSGS